MNSSQTSTAQFQYEPLENAKKQIRLLCHVPRNSPDELAFEMIIAQDDVLDTSPQLDESTAKLSFHAISYTWGNPAELATITVNSSPFIVRRNAYYALWQHRQHHPENLVWMDSICINQNDLREKSQQVAIMGEIYFAAELVVSCIGPHEQDSELLPSFFEELREAKVVAQKAARLEKQFHRHNKDAMVSWFQKLEEERRRRIFCAVNAFMHRTYWTRLWIVQENHRARESEILCGQDVIDWWPVRVFMEEIHGWTSDFRVSPSETLNVLPANPVATLLTVLDGALIGDTPDVLRAFGSFVCSDPRDRIFALLPLLRSAEFAPDYGKSAFELAVDVVVSLSKEISARRRPLLRLAQLDDVRTVLRSLKMHGRSPEIRAAVRKRQKKGIGADFDVSSVNRDVHHSSREHSHAQRLKDGVEVREMVPGALAVHLSRDEEDDRTTNRLAHQIVSPDQEHKALYVGPNVAALVCNSTLPGDILIPIDGLQSDSQTFVILRRLDDEFYGVVGQGFTVDGYEICDFGDCISKEEHLRVGADVVLSPLDAIVLAYQDVAEDETEMFDQRARLERLTTTVSKEYRLAARQEPGYDGGVASVDMQAGRT